MYIFNTNTAEILNGRATQNNGLKRLFRKVRTYRRLWTLPLTWIVESAEAFIRYSVKTSKFQPGFFFAIIRGILAIFARESLAHPFPDFARTKGQGENV